MIFMHVIYNVMVFSHYNRTSALIVWVTRIVRVLVVALSQIVELIILKVLRVIYITLQI